MPVLVVLSVFTVLLAVIAGVRRQGLPEGERFVARVGASRALGQYYLTDRPITSQPHSAISPRDIAECFEISSVEHCLRL